MKRFLLKRFCEAISLLIPTTLLWFALCYLDFKVVFGDSGKDINFFSIIWFLVIADLTYFYCTNPKYPPYLDEKDE